MRKDVAVGNAENSFKGQVVSCTRRVLAGFQQALTQLRWLVNSTNYLDMLELLAVSKMTHLQPNVFFKKDDVPPYWALIVREREKCKAIPVKGREGP
jgi:hypothetical protein